VTDPLQHIRRWLKYRTRKLRKSGQNKSDPRKDPWAVLLAKFSGVLNPPKAWQAYQQFMAEAYSSVIEPVVKQKWTEAEADGSNVQTGKELNAPFRVRIARELFAGLPDDVRSKYADAAKAEAAAARTLFNKALKDPPSQTPEAKQL
jgi:hypothetical protein